MYESKIKYLEYRVGGVRVKGAGFVRLELRGDLCNIRLNISGVAGESSSRANGDRHLPVHLYLSDGEKEAELAAFELSDGRANCEFLCLQAGNLKGTGIAYEHMSMLRIPLTAQGEIVCMLGEGRRWQDTAEPEALIAASGGQISEAPAVAPGMKTSEASAATISIQSPKNSAGALGMQARETSAAILGIQSPEVPNTTINRQMTETSLSDGAVSDRKMPLEGQDFADLSTREDRMWDVSDKGRPVGVKESDQQKGGEERKSAGNNVSALYDDKWRQLSAIYPHITPFQDEREYLSLRPEDFVILSEKDYELIHNSFLLHGYYNYRHLILRRMEKRGEVRYYLGVPGNFYEREKQVAVMFGFESFECLEEPAGNGDYGYYMVPVEL